MSAVPPGVPGGVLGAAEPDPVRGVVALLCAACDFPPEPAGDTAVTTSGFARRRHYYGSIRPVNTATSDLEDEHLQVLLQATGRRTITDALHWIAEGRSLRGRRDRLLVALVAATDRQLPRSVESLRAVSRKALNSTLDTSADLLETSTVIPPHRYQRALADVADRTTGTSLSNITVEAVGAAQSENSLVIEALALTAGLSYRDLHERANVRGTTLPGESRKPWSASQVRAAFEVIDEVVQGTGAAQLSIAVAARPIELLLPGTTGWDAIEALRTGGVSYGTLLAQRDVGSAWGAHRNRTNNEVSRLMVRNLLEALDGRGVTYWSIEGAGNVSKAYLTDKAMTSGNKLGQVTVVTRGSDGAGSLAVLVAVARDGGTARKSAGTILKLREVLKLPGAAVLIGTGWANRGESDDLVRAFKGRVFNEQSLEDLAELAAERAGLSDPSVTLPALPAPSPEDA
jgi:hypothetical protein